MSNPRAELIDGLLRDGWKERPPSSAALVVLRNGDALVMAHVGRKGMVGCVTVGDLCNETLAEFTPFAEDSHIRAFIDANYPPPVAHQSDENTPRGVSEGYSRRNGAEKP